MLSGVSRSDTRVRRWAGGSGWRKNRAGWDTSAGSERSRQAQRPQVLSSFHAPSRRHNLGCMSCFLSCCVGFNVPRDSGASQLAVYTLS
eukprot:2685845-Rhodomonas_salina.1